LTAFDTAWGLLKGTRRFEYDADYDYLPDKKAMQVAGMTNREDMVKPGPLPGFVYYSDLFQGIDNKLMTEAEAEKLWPSHIDSKAFLAPTKVGLKRYAEMANWGGFGKPRDTHFDTKRTIDKFTADIAPEMAHEVGHALDSQFREGSFAQREMPAHVLEMATRAAMQDRGGRHTPEPIIPKARSRVLDRIYTGEDYTGSYPTTIQTPYDNPDYQYDITDDKIIAGEPMEVTMRLLKDGIMTPYDTASANMSPEDRTKLNVIIMNYFNLNDDIPIEEHNEHVEAIIRDFRSDNPVFTQYMQHPVEMGQVGESDTIPTPFGPMKSNRRNDIMYNPVVDTDWQEGNKGEPMEVAMRLLKGGEPTIEFGGNDICPKCGGKMVQRRTQLGFDYPVVHGWDCPKCESFTPHDNKYAITPRPIRVCGKCKGNGGQKEYNKELDSYECDWCDGTGEFRP